MKKIKISLIIVIMFLFVININKVNGAEELPDDGGRISSSQVIQTKTGTGPFDENDEPGNDSSEDNNIVRSFDQVTWTIENTMVLNGNEADSYSGGRIYFEAVLPDVFTSETAKWDLDSMAWIENAQVSSDGLTLTGYYQMGTENITVPGKQTLVFVAKILGAANGIEFEPEIKLWLNGNSEENYKTVNMEKITVSAAPSYNIRFVRNNNLQNLVNDIEINGNIYEKVRVYGYSVTLQLYNSEVSKGMKGIEYPQGDITFDVNMQLNRSDFNGNLEDITQYCTPILWDYKINNFNTYGNLNRNMVFTNESGSAGSSAPLGSLSNPLTSVYNSGKIDVMQEGATLKFKISNYKFNGTFPKYNNIYNISTASINYTENIGCFSVGYFQIMIPYNEYSTVENRNYYLKLEDSNFKATSLSGKEVNEQVKETDDSSNVQHVVYKKGSYSQLYNCFHMTKNLLLFFYRLIRRCIYN